MRYWFTADWHLGHDLIIPACNRPFRGIEEMHEELVRRYNEVVDKHDAVYFLGDTVWNKKYAYHLDRLKGNKIYIAGNHDKAWLKRKHMDIWHFKAMEPGFYMAHLPLMTWPTMVHGEGHIHGHCHGTLPDARNRIDVGVDNWKYYPVPYEEIINIFKKPLTIGMFRDTVYP